MLQSRSPDTERPAPSRIGSWTLRDGAWAVAGFCLLHLLLWGGGFALAFSTPRLDGAEQLVWAISPEAGYWKHPPLPSWIMRTLVEAFGVSAGLTYVAAQACIVLALAILWRLGSEFMPWRRSLAALVLTSLVSFYNSCGDAFNHDYALLPFAAGFLFFSWRALSRGRWSDWALAGVAAGLALLCKYMAVLHILAVLAYVASDRQLHHRRTFAGMALAAAVALAIFAPHLAWLVHNDYPPLRYVRAVAEAQAGDRIAGALMFLAGIVMRALPSLFVAWFALRGAPALTGRRVEGAVPNSRRFLWVVGTVPLLLLLTVALGSGTEPPLRWATTAFPLCGWLLMDLWPRELDAARLKRLVASALAMHVILCVSTVVVRPMAASALRLPGRTNFPAEALAEAARGTWDAHAPGPVRLVIAGAWIGGNLVAQFRDPRLAVLVDGERAKAPWVPLEAVYACGALVMIDQDPDPSIDEEARERLRDFIDLADERGEWALSWPGSRPEDSSPPRARISWGIIAPDPALKCSL